MLVLNRRIGERIIIDSHIELIVTAIRGNQVRLGIVAPRDVTIHREEVQRRVAIEQIAGDTL